MPHYRKKPVVVEMIQWTGENLDDVRAFMAAQSQTPQVPLDNEKTRSLVFTVAHGASLATIYVGDWIAAERDGAGFYPISQHDQLDAYEPDPVETVEEFEPDDDLHSI